MRRDALDGERPGRHRPAQPRGVRQHPAADAGVDVAAHAARGRRGAAIAGDRVDDAVGVRRRARRRRAPSCRRWRRPWRRGRRAEVGVDVGRAPPHAEVVRRPCGTPRAPVSARTMLGSRDVGPAVARGLHREQDRLGAAGGDRADAAGPGRRAGRRRRRRGRSPSCSSDGNAVGSRPFEAAYTATRLAADPVGVGEPGVVDVGQRAAAVGRQVTGLQGSRAGRGPRLMQRSSLVTRAPRGSSRYQPGPAG